EYDYYHSLVSFEDTREIHWGQTIPVQCQTLGSLVDDKQIPAQVGILKVDTEGNDYAVIQGMGTLQCDVIMVEYWEKLPDVIGTCPWRLADMVAMLAGRSYSNFIFVKHNGPTTTMQVNNLQMRDGDWGNVLFVHDRVQAQLEPIL